MGRIFHRLYDIFLPQRCKYSVIYFVENALWVDPQHRHYEQQMVLEMAVNLWNDHTCFESAWVGTTCFCGLFLLVTISPSQ
jgi:hypothetical protein